MTQGVRLTLDHKREWENTLQTVAERQTSYRSLTKKRITEPGKLTDGWIPALLRFSLPRKCVNQRIAWF